MNQRWEDQERSSWGVLEMEKEFRGLLYSEKGKRIMKTYYAIVYTGPMNTGQVILRPDGLLHIYSSRSKAQVEKENLRFGAVVAVKVVKVAER